MFLAVAAFAWQLVHCTVPFDTTDTGATRNVWKLEATCATVDSLERPLPLYGDSAGGVLEVRASGTAQRMWIQVPADRRARLVWVSARDYPAPVSNRGPRGTALGVIAGVADTIVYAVASPLRSGEPQARWTVPSARDVQIRVATFSFSDSVLTRPTWLTGPGYPPLMWFGELLAIVKPTICAIYGHYGERGQSWLCP